MFRVNLDASFREGDDLNGARATTGCREGNVRGIATHVPIHALLRAESSSIRAFVGGKDRERRATRFAGLQRTAMSVSLFVYNVRFIVTDAISTLAIHVTRMTGRDKVLRAVVMPLAVQVIDRQRTLRSFLPRHPINHISAPVTGMRAGTDALIQQEPMSADLMMAVRKRVAGDDDVPIRLAIHNRIASLCNCATGARTELPHPSINLRPKQHEGGFAHLAAALNLVSRLRNSTFWHVSPSFQWAKYTTHEMAG
jgi:hypothetical protein